MDLSGPWLLDDTALTHLDDLLIPEWQRLCATRQEAIEVDLNQRVNEYRQRNNGCEPDEQELRYFRERATISVGPKIRRMALRLKGRHSVVVESFREALRSAELIDQVPTCCGQGKTDTQLSNPSKFLIFIGTDIPEIRVLPSAVVEHLDVSDNIVARLSTRSVIMVRRPLTF
jgi:hypothetical protein